MAKAKKSTVEANRKAKAKIVAEGKQKAKHAAVLTQLSPIAKEINHKLDKAEKSDSQAADYRVSAALRLAEAAKICKKAKITFKKWAEENVEKSYHTVVLLARAGAEKDTMAAVMLIRSKNAEHNRVHREKKKVISRENTPETVSPFQRAVDSISVLEDQAALNLAKDIAATNGMAVLSGHDVGALADFRKARTAAAKLGLDRVQHDFDSLSASDKMALVKYAAKKVGVEIVEPVFDPVVDRPAFLDRTTKDKVIKRGAVA